jgi:glucose-1-phosphate cytidylyltransferase
MLTYGDGLASVDLTALEAFHRGHGKVATVTAVRPPARFGELGLTGDAVSEFAEKPNARGGFINGGYFVCDGRRIWDYLKGDQGLVFEQEPLRDLTAAGELMAFKHEGFWQPVDTLREYNQMNDHWSSGKAPWLKR